MGFMLKHTKRIKKNIFFLLRTLDMANKLLKKIPSFPCGLYYTYIKPVKHVAYKVIFQNVNTFQTWHDRLGHPGVGMMQKIFSNSIGHNLQKAKFPQSMDFVYCMCKREVNFKTIIS
jgi:hypothetical protein